MHQLNFRVIFIGLAAGGLCLLITACSGAASVLDVPTATRISLPTGLSSTTPSATLAPSPSPLLPTSLIVTSTPPDTVPSPQPWNAALRLLVDKPDGVWLRSEPSYLSLDENTVILPYQSAVRVIGQPVYEADPGQWWWLVSAEGGGIGWAEESAFVVAEVPLLPATPTPVSDIYAPRSNSSS